MSNAPNVNFTFENNNVQESTPQLGVSFVFARTTKGPKTDPSTIISSISQFQRVYGQEIIPGQSVSQIEKALKGGSKLRICRILADDATQGTDLENLLKFTIDGVTIALGFKTQGYGEQIDGYDIFGFRILQRNNSYYAQIESAKDGSILESIYLFKYNETTDGDIQMDASGITKYNSLSSYLNISVDSDTEVASGVTTLTQAKNWLENAATSISMEGIDTYKTDCSVGSAGSDPTVKEWEDAIETLKDYTDVYHVVFSGIRHHLSENDANILHTEMVTLCDELEEYMYFIELPWWDDGGEGAAQQTEPSTITNASKLSQISLALIQQIGNSKWSAIFSGGLKYYDNEGELQNCDIIGAILGLADTVATSRGYHESFAGLQKGLIPDALGPVIPNYGSPARYDELNELAENYINVTTLQDTPSAGKQPILWNNFTTQFKQDSFRFISIARLCLYIKKTLRPILRKYIEEPNIWSTWKKIYLEVKPTLDSLVDADAISEYTWQGDQDAQSYDDLQINTEAEVRQGIYKVRLRIKDIVPLQEINIAVVIDASSQSVSITTED